jgi:hypothetical protein
MRSGVVAEFDTADALARAYERLRRAGYTRLAAWTPYPVRGVLAGLPQSIVGWVMLGAGLLGGGLGYLVQWWCNALDYPIDVGGRPLHSAPAFVPIAFESAVLAAALAGFFTMLGLCALPRLHDPIFEVDGFERASVDRFWIGVDEHDPLFDERVAGELEAMGALRAARVRAERES